MKKAKEALLEILQMARYYNNGNSRMAAKIAGVKTLEAAT